MDTSFRLEDVYSRINFRLAESTTYGLGGTAKIAYYPKNIDEVCGIYDTLTNQDEKFFILGKGSNILVSDAGFNGAVICTCKLKGLRKKGNLIQCDSGVTVGEILNYCISNACGGLEYLAGIPASLGGLVCMNGGANGQYISKNVVTVTIYDGKIRTLTQEECHFSVKHSTMQDIKCVILSMELKTTNDLKENIRNKIKMRINERKSQPKGKSCGCVFKNPEGISAGKLIDECGLKGYRIGGALISPEHANFILNDGATAADIYNLISFIKKTVFQKTGIELEEEVIYIGDFHDFNG